MTISREFEGSAGRRRLLTALTLGLAHGRSRARSSAAPIVVGVISELSGPGAAYGRDLLRGAQMAAREINAAGGVNGRPLELRVADGGTHPARSAIAMRRLVSSDVALVVGGWGSAQVLANLEVAEEAAMPYIVVGATHPAITAPRNRWTFRVIQTDARQADVLAATLVERLRVRRIAAITDDSPYGIASRDLFIAALARRGVTLLRSETFSASTPDLGPAWQRLKDATPEVLGVFATVPVAPRVMQHARAAGLSARFVGTGGLAHQDLPTLAAGAAEGTLLTGLFHEEADDESRAWAARYRAAFPDPSAPPQPQLAAWEYRAVRFIAAPCLARVAPEDRVALRDCIAKWRGRLFGVAGELHFDGNRQLVQPVLLLEVRGGRLSPWKDA